MFGSRKAKPGSSGPKKVLAPEKGAVPAESPARKDRENPEPAESAEAMLPQVRQRHALAIRQSLAFAQVVSVMMRSSFHKHLTVGDLEWFVLPPLRAGQFRVAQARIAQDGPALPAAVALWARVSAEVDKRLTNDRRMPIRLRPDEWQSGDILWLIDVVGDSRVIPQLMKNLGETAFKGREVKMRAHGEDGKRVAKTAHLSGNGGQPPKAQ